MATGRLFTDTGAEIEPEDLVVEVGALQIGHLSHGRLVQVLEVLV